MYAQVIKGGTTPERRDAMDRIVTDAMNVAAISTGTRRPISVWEVNARV